MSSQSLNHRISMGFTHLIADPFPIHMGKEVQAYHAPLTKTTGRKVTVNYFERRGISGINYNFYTTKRK